MDKYTKIQSIESGEITATDNLRNFKIPRGEVYSLRDSFVEFECSVDVTEGEPLGGVGIYNTNVRWISTKYPHFYNSVFVKNAHVSSDLKGQIEHIRRNDILQQNLGILDKSFGNKKDASYIDINQIQSPINKQQYGRFINMEKVGIVKSTNKRITPLTFRLNEVFDFCDVDEYDTNKGGALNFHFELNRDKLESYISMKNADSVPAEVKSFMTVAAGVGNNIIMGSATTQTRVENLDQIPYYVGMKILVTGTCVQDAAKSVTDKPAVISGIIWTRPNAADQSKSGQYLLSFEQDWGVALGGAEEYTGITVKIEENITTALRINTANLVLKKLNDDERKNYDEIDYMTYSAEEGNAGTTTSFQRLFTVEPTATQAFMCFPKNDDGIISSNQIDSFRCALNNISVTNRDVLRRSPLYYDRLSSTLRGMRRGLKDAHSNAGTSAQSNSYTSVWSDAALQSEPLVASLFRTDSIKFLQVKAECPNGAGDFVLFKSIPRKFVY